MFQFSLALILWHINHCRLFNAKSSLYICIKYIWVGWILLYGISHTPIYIYIYIYICVCVCVCVYVCVKMNRSSCRYLSKLFIFLLHVHLHFHKEVDIKNKYIYRKNPIYDFSFYILLFLVFCILLNIHRWSINTCLSILNVLIKIH